LTSVSINKKLHVIHLLPNLNIGGMENGVVNLLNHGNMDKFKLSLICLEAEGPLKDRISNKHVEIINLKQKSGKRFFLILKLAKLFKNMKADIIHTHNFYTGIYGISAGKLARVPVLVHGEHGGFHDLKVTKLGKIKFLYKFCHSIITVSYSLRDDIIANIPSIKDKMVCIINGVDTIKFKKKSTNSQNIKDTIVLGTVGRLTPEKDYKTLLKAFKILSSEFSNSKLKFIGKGDLDEELKKTSRELGVFDKVEFLGSRNDIPEILNSFNIFVLSSIREGCSNAILEAFATGLPVVATKVGDNPILLENGRGLLVPPQNEIELASAIKTIILDKEKRNNIAETSYKWVTQKRSIQSMIDEYENLYIQLYNKNSGII
jgi:sugar transferase (PEP-CTERM/EpsH1 system associated)